MKDYIKMVIEIKENKSVIYNKLEWIIVKYREYFLYL